MAIDASIVKELRGQTGAGILDCKKALDQSNGPTHSYNLKYPRLSALLTPLRLRHLWPLI